ncbi:MAG: PDR/VanB family oxidoreductase [Rhodococcus sp. (in: high G+C Gram-positive bacteria)]
MTKTDEPLRVRVLQLRWEADDVVSIQFDSADDRPLPTWSPGDHIDLHLPGGVVRQYSLCGDPEPGAPWRIAVLRVAGGRGGSAAVHDTIRPGDVLRVAGPRNNFEFRAAHRYLFLAGGIGITPIVPMIRQAAAATAQWQLWYGGRTLSKMAFVPELVALERKSECDESERVRIAPQDTDGMLPLDAILREPIPETLIYCCGPTPMLDAIAHAAAHWPQDSLVMERFAPKADSDDGAPRSGFDVEAARSGITVHVRPESTIVEALEAAGITPDTSCLEGICGTCETKVLAGVPEHRDSLLSDAEREANHTMMICVGRSRGPKLVLDV